MKEKTQRILYIPSAVAFFSLWSYPRQLIVLLYVCMGVFCGIVVAVFGRERTSRRSLFAVLASLLSILLLIHFARMFYTAWMDSPALADLLSEVSLDASAVLPVLCWVLAIAAFPFVERIVESFLRFLWHALFGIDYAKLGKELAECTSSRGGGKTILGLTLNLLLAAAFGLLLLTLVFTLPDRPVVDHLTQSLTVLVKEDKYPVLSPYCTSTLDNYTDSIMLGSAAFCSETSCLDRAMMAYCGCTPGLGPADSLIAHYRDGVPFDYVYGYSRYWHGYLVFLRPLLSLMTYSSIRLCNGICQFSLVLLIGILLIRRRMPKLAVAWWIAWLMLMPLALAMSLQFSACFYVLSFGSLALLLIRRDRLKAASIFVFFNLGIATAFFDLLTYPLATFGVPSVFLLFLCRDDSAESKLGTMIKTGIAWCVGYAGMWFLKLLLGTLITGEDVIADALGAFGFRTSATDGVRQFSASVCLSENISLFLATPFTLLAFIFLIVVLFRRLNSRPFSEEDARIFFPYFLLCLAPMVWYLFALNHSSIHTVYTNKACVVSLLALLVGVADLAEPREKALFNVTGKIDEGYGALSAGGEERNRK